MRELPVGFFKSDGSFSSLTIWKKHNENLLVRDMDLQKSI